MIRHRLRIFAQYLAPQRLLTQLAGWLAERRTPWFKNWQINYLINQYGANLQEAVLTRLEDYPTFNSFFTRQIRPELRPIVSASDAIASPADGTISQCGRIENDTLLQAKGHYFTLQRLLGGDIHLANHFENGEFATIYLAPKDYHRVHMPMTGVLRETIFIPGTLFSVNQLTANYVPELFAKNERLVCLFETAIGPMAVILVGAMLVGSMNTVWGGEARGNTIQRQTFPETGNGVIAIERGNELGHFKMGSTVILLFPKNTVHFPKATEIGAAVKMGEQLGSLHFAPSVT